MVKMLREWSHEIMRKEAETLFGIAVKLKEIKSTFYRNNRIIKYERNQQFKRIKS